MKSRVSLAMLFASVLALPSSGVTQTTGQLAPVAVITANSSDVTFTMPLNFTHLSSDIAKIRVDCIIRSAALPSRQAREPGIAGKTEEYPVVAGQLVRTATVVVPISDLDNPAGKSASYICSTMGFSTSQQKWDVFDSAQPTLAFRLSPAPANLTGNFTW
jgi:hypothetical protein